MTRAAVMYNFFEPLRVESLTVNPPREDEVVVRLAASGVCHTDLSVVEAKLPVPPPVVLGHEGAGIVEEVGKAVTDLKPGDHVVLSWVQNCGKCPYCVAGRHHLCDAGPRAMLEGQEFVFEKDGMPIARMAGVASFAERTVVRATAAIKIPDDVPLDRACLVGCGVMTGVGAAINTVQIRPGQTVAVFGCGGVGLNVIQGAALCSPSRIIAVDMLPTKLDMAKRFGATDTIAVKDVDDVPEAIRGDERPRRRLRVRGQRCDGSDHAVVPVREARRHGGRGRRPRIRPDGVDPGSDDGARGEGRGRLAVRLGQHAPRYAAAARVVHA